MTGFRIFRFIAVPLSLLLLWSAYSGWWGLSLAENLYEIGPRGVRFCRESVCTWGGIDRLATGDTWGLLGTTTLVSTTIAACGMLFLGVAPAAKVRLVAKYVTGLCFFGLGLGVALAAKAPVVEGMRHTMALAAYFIATGAGIGLGTVLSSRR